MMRGSQSIGYLIEGDSEIRPHTISSDDPGNESKFSHENIDLQSSRTLGDRPASLDLEQEQNVSSRRPV